MADRDLRNAERDWHTCGTSDQEAALLRELLKSGRLLPRDIAVAAHIGHIGAYLFACGAEIKTPPFSPDELGSKFTSCLADWIQGLLSIKAATLVAAGLVLQQGRLLSRSARGDLVVEVARAVLANEMSKEEAAWERLDKAAKQAWASYGLASDSDSAPEVSRFPFGNPLEAMLFTAFALERVLLEEEVAQTLQTALEASVMRLARELGPETLLASLQEELLPIVLIRKLSSST